MLQEIRLLIEKLNHFNDKKSAQNIAFELANKILLHFGAPKEQLKTIEEALESSFTFSYFKNQKMETWFETHRFYDSDRFAFKLYDNKLSSFESSFFHLTESSTKARIASTTLLGTNWEDSELTELPEYKVGIDFFLNHESNALLMVVSKRGNIRAIEFSERLTNTQVEILDDLKGVLSYEGLDPETGKHIPREPQKTIHEMLWKSLQLNEVNKKFYQGISEHFQLLVSELKRKHVSLDEKDIQLFSSRLIGRLLFIWFLRKMDLINPGMNYFDLNDQDASLYYESKIKPLFFETLNLPVPERRHKDFKTPFLNGGLFEIQENDFYNISIKFPVTFFESLYEHLNSFNFTVDESTPEYEQVAIDPEMLGRVFENLLASIVPETSNAANERKNKGAFYTPREIVSFMCKESLKEYMKSRLEDESLTPGVEKLIDLNDAKFLELKSTGLADLWGVRSKDVVPKLINVLNDVKVFDPACGSGAFPMGMLQLISRTYDRLTAKYDIEKRRHVYASGRSTYNKYESKLNIIKNNLYGSDIEPMAIEIARLRSWLSLIIEEKGEAHPLPNLVFNFVCSNTLIKLESDKNLFGMSFEDEFEILREKYYNAHSKEAKLRLRKEFDELYQNNYDDSLSSRRIQQLKSWNPFDISKPSEFFDTKIMFNIESFDIVIANPPYIGEKGNRDLFSKLKNTELFNKYYVGKMDYYYFFFHLGIDNLSKDGILTFITTNYYITADGAYKLREDLFQKTHILKMLNFNEFVIFDSAKGQHDMITVLKKTKNQNLDTFQLNLNLKLAKSNNLTEILTNINNYSKLKKNELFEIHDESKYYIRFKLDDSVEEDLLKKINLSTKLSNYATVNQGIISGADKLSKAHLRKYNLENVKQGDSIFVFKKGELKDFKLKDKLIKPFYKNSDIQKWNTSVVNKFEIFYPDEKVEISVEFLDYISKFKKILKSRREFSDGKRVFYDLHRKRDYRIFENQKIVAPQRSYFNTFAYHDGSFYASADVYFINAKKGVDIFYLLGILNSNVIFYWLYNRGKKKGDMLELYRTPLLEIPIPKESDDLKKEISVVSKKITLNLEFYLEQDLNKLVYKIFKLNNKEIKTIEEFVLKSIR